MTLSGQLQSAGVQFGLLTDPLTGIHDPNRGAMFFAVLAAAAQIERNYIREKTHRGANRASRLRRHRRDPVLLRAAGDEPGPPVAAQVEGGRMRFGSQDATGCSGPLGARSGWSASKPRSGVRRRNPRVSQSR
ncbi:recombinase family protein [Streptomyces sp. NPDC001312]|uniref:recombinase family protein n=1 Tax=Streptomyces sp. NPDC001312 TaxID=3364561 RepID=UPI00369A5DAE